MYTWIECVESYTGNIVLETCYKSKNIFVHLLSKGLPPISAEPSSDNSAASSEPVKESPKTHIIARERCNANYLLNASAKGRAILHKCQKQAFLSKTDKRAITHIVVDEFKDQFGKLTPAELRDRASELAKLFPGEAEVIYFIEDCRTSLQNRSLKYSSKWSAISSKFSGK